MLLSARGIAHLAVLVTVVLLEPQAAAGPRASAPPGAGIGEAEIRELSERAKRVYRESRGRSGDFLAPEAFVAALDDVEAALRDATPEALPARLVFLDHWVNEAAWSSARGAPVPVLEERAAGYARELLGLMRSDRVPVEAWERLQRETRFPSRRFLLALWLASEPRNPHVLAALGDSSNDLRLRLALYRAASEVLSHPPAVRKEEDLALRLLQERVAALLELGLAEEALQEVETAPAPLGRLLLEAPAAASEAVDLEVPGPAIRLESRDQRLDLAAAYALRGDATQAARLLAALPEPAPHAEPGAGPEPAPHAEPGAGLVADPDVVEGVTLTLQTRSLARLLALSGALSAPPPAEDPFIHFMDLLAVRHGAYRIEVLWRRVEASLAEAAGYPDLAAHLLVQACRYLGPWTGDHELKLLAPFGGLPQVVLAELEAVDESRARLRAASAAAVERFGSSLPWVTPPSCPDPIGPAGPAVASRPRVPAGTGIESLAAAHPQKTVSHPTASDGMAAPDGQVRDPLLDSDGDGLTDLEERAIHTDPYDPDTDGDGEDDVFDRLTDPGTAVTADRDTARVLALVAADVLAPPLPVGCTLELPPPGLAIPSGQTSFVAAAGVALDVLPVPGRVVLVEGSEEVEGRVLRVDLLVFDRNRSRAFVEWRLSAGGGLEASSGRHLLVRPEDRAGEWRLLRGVVAGGCSIDFRSYG